jgi:hypothetical protein
MAYFVELARAVWSVSLFWEDHPSHASELFFKCPVFLARQSRVDRRPVAD